MKKKLLLSMACATVLLGACQQDEWMEEGNFATVDPNRAMIDLKLSADEQSLESGDAGTKMGAEVVGNSMVYSWISTDKIGAAVMDGQTADTYNPNNVVSFNYPFAFTAGAAEGESSFTAPTPIMSGIYFFYHQYEQNTAREALTLKMEDQQAYVGGEKAETAENQMAQYIIGISPAIKLSEGIKMSDNGESTLALPVGFKKINAAVRFTLTPKDLPAGTEITKIVVEKTGMVMGGQVDFVGANNVLGAASAAIDVMSYDETAQEGNENGALDAAELAKVKEAIATAADGINLASLFAASGKVTKNAVTLSLYADETAKANGERGITLANNTPIQVYMVLSAVGTAATDDYTVKIYTTEGYIEKTVEGLAIESGKVYASKFAFDLEADELEDVEVFEIANSTDWNEAIEYVTNHMDPYVGQDKIKFNITSTEEEPIYISSLPAYGINLSGDAAYYLCLGNQNGSAANFTLSESALKLADANLNLMIGKGATVTMDALPTKSASETFKVINNGTLTVATDVQPSAGAATVSGITNNGTLTFSAAQATSDVTITNKGELTFKGGTALVPNTYKVALTNWKNVTIDANANVEAATTFFNNGNAQAHVETVTINGKLSGNAIDALAEKYVIGATGELAPKTSGSIAAGAVVDNSGKLTVATGLTNNGTINLKKGAKSSNVAITNAGTIVIEDYEDYYTNQKDANTPIDKYNISGTGVVTAKVASKAQFNQIATEASTLFINNATISGAWGVTSAGSGDNEVTAVNFAAIGVTLDNATLSVAADVTTTGKDLILQGNSSIALASSAAVKLTYDKVTVAKGANTSIAKDVTLTVGADDNVILGTLTNNGTITSSAAWELTVGESMPPAGGRHPAQLINGKDGVIGTNGTAEVTITNYGYIDFKQGVAYGSNTNKESARFEGNMQ